MSFRHSNSRNAPAQQAARCQLGLPPMAQHLSPFAPLEVTSPVAALAPAAKPKRTARFKQPTAVQAPAPRSLHQLVDDIANALSLSQPHRPLIAVSSGNYALDSVALDTLPLPSAEIQRPTRSTQPTRTVRPTRSSRRLPRASARFVPLVEPSAWRRHSLWVAACGCALAGLVLTARTHLSLTTRHPLTLPTTVARASATPPIAPSAEWPQSTHAIQAAAAVNTRTFGRQTPPPVPQAVALTSNIVPFELRAGALVVNAVVKGNSNTATLSMMVDTGATYSMLSQSAAQRLGLATSTATVNVSTLNGHVQRQLSVVDSLGLGSATINERLAVIVCDQCMVDGVDGLIGLNALRHFNMSIDHQHKFITLTAQPLMHDPSFDIAPFVKLQRARLSEISGGSQLAVELENLAPHALFDLEAELQLEGPTTVRLGQLTLKELPSAGSQHLTITLATPIATQDAGAIRLVVTKAHW